MSRLIYDDDDDFLNGEQPNRYEFADGDGSVNIVSLNLCENWNNRSGRDFLAETKVFQVNSEIRGTMLRNNFTN
jgi:hypothetical protein